MGNHTAFQWIDSQKNVAIDLLQSWASINSWSENSIGLNLLSDAIRESFKNLGEIHKIALPSWKRWDHFGKPYETDVGPLLQIQNHSKRKSGRKILLGGHMDTVYPPTSSFQQSHLNHTRLLGPGVADMKGGLVVLWLAITAFERFNKDQLDWEIIISPDEEIGSPSSRPIWEKSAKESDIGLLFEPSYPDGALVSSRKGSITFTIYVKGKSAHVGRDYHAGKNAVKALSTFIVKGHEICEKYPDTTLNFAYLSGGVALNIVPEFASSKGNIRSFNSEHLNESLQKLEELGKTISKNQQVEITLQIEAQKPAKPFEGKTAKLFEALNASALEFNEPLLHRQSGGLSDGNILQAAGLPTIDTLGVIGGNLHTQDEYMIIDSLPQRAKLTYHFLTQYAQGKFPELTKRGEK